MSTLTLKKPLPEWRKNFKPGEKVDPDKVDRLMAKTYPHLFRDRANPAPLKVGIHRDLIEDPKLPVTNKQLRHFLYRWTQQAPYQRALRAGKERVSL